MNGEEVECRVANGAADGHVGVIYDRPVSPESKGPNHAARQQRTIADCSHSALQELVAQYSNSR